MDGRSLKDIALFWIHFLIKAVLGSLVMVFCISAFSDWGLLITFGIDYLIYHLLWPADHRQDELLRRGPYEDDRWNCYIPAEGEENEWCFRTRYR